MFIKTDSNHSNRPSNSANGFVKGLKPIRFILRALGFLPYSIKYNSSGDVIGSEIKIVDFIWFFMSIMCYLLLALIYYFAFDVSMLNYSYALAMGNYVGLMFALISNVIFIALDMFNRNGMITIIMEICNFDKEVIWTLFNLKLLNRLL